jgi:hypothetical protein
MLEVGFNQLLQREFSSVYLEEVVEDQRLPGAEDNEPAPSALPRPQVIEVEDNGRLALRDGTADVVITRKILDEEEVPQAGGSAGERVGKGRRELRINRNALRPIVDALRATNQLPDSFDLDSLLNVVGTYEIRYRDRDGQSERALQVLERILAQLNVVSIQSVVPGYQPPFRLLATPVIMKSNYADLLATMVPLVLVLMTMAGRFTQPST